MRETHESFSDDDLFPLAKIKCEDERNFSAYGNVRLSFRNGMLKTLDFSFIEANLTM